MNKTTTDTVWTGLRVRFSTATLLKKLTAALRKDDPTATLDSVLSTALIALQSKKGVSDATLRNIHLPKDGRAAGAQARSARVSNGEES